MTKKRYNLTLTQETVEEFQELAKSLKMAPSAMSAVCDEAIAGVMKVVKQAKSTGKFTITDLFTMMGEITQEAMEVEKNETRAIPEKQTPTKQKRKKTPTN